jgi:signal transduction histidine kinase
MNVFYEKRKTHLLVMVFLYSLLPVLLIILEILHNNGISVALFGSNYVTALICYLPILFIITLNYESSIIKRMVAAVYVFITFEAILTFIGNLILFPIFSLFSPSNRIIYNVVAEITASIVLFFAAILLLKYFKFLKKKAFDFPAFWGLALIIAVSFMLGGLQHASVISVRAYTILYPFVLTGSTFLVFYLYNVLSKSHEEKLASAIHSQEKEYYFNQCRLMQESAEKINAMCHDMKKHFIALKEFSADNKTATDYLNSLIDDVKHKEVFSKTGNIAFDSVINYKLNAVLRDNIELDINTFIPPVLNVEAVDIVTILGNLLDNALDALSKVENKILSLNIQFDKSSLLIKIENSFDGIVEYKDKKEGEDKIIVTRKNNIKNGYGLKNIKNSIEKYNGYIEITHDNNIFSVGILLYVDD